MTGQQQPLVTGTRPVASVARAVRSSWSSFLTLPILWMYLGPPILRPPTGRGAMESVAGQFDVWNVLRLVWWAAAAVVAVLAIYLHQRHVRAFVRTMPQMVLWSLVFVSTLVVSSVYSPSPLFTFANAVMMVALVVAAFDVGLRLYAGTIELDTVLRGLLVASVAIQALILGAFFVVPGMVSGVYGFGLRLIGGNLGSNTGASIVVLFASVYFLMRRPGRAAPWYWLLIVVSSVMLLLGQTRTAYVGVGLGLVYFALQWVVVAGPRARALALGVALVTAGLVPPAVLAIDTVTGTGSVPTALGYLIRDQGSLRTGSGRTAVGGLLLEHVREQPWGLGYSAGPRVVLQTSFSELAEQGVHAEGIGNAHNVFLEVLAGGGVLSLFAYLATFVWVAFNLHRTNAPGALLTRVLFLYTVLSGLTASNGVLPFFQASVLAWAVFGIAAGLNGIRIRVDASTERLPVQPTLRASDSGHLGLRG